MAPSLGSPDLILIPTALELERLRDHGGFESHGLLVRVCGFGAVAAAARTAQVLAELRPRRALLIGIAGAYDDRVHPIGSAVSFARVGIEGIGAGEGETLLGPPALGFPQWPGSAATVEHPIMDELPLVSGSKGADLLLSTCAASATAEQANLRRRRHPAAVAEDMEGFSVAVACALERVPLSIVRGISNVVGVRDPAQWRIGAALCAARELALELLEPESAS